MTWHWLRNAGFRIAVPIVLGAMSHEHAAYTLYLSNQIASFHDTTSSSTLRIPATTPALKSR